MVPRKVRSVARVLAVSALLLTGCRSATAPGYLVKVFEIAPQKVPCTGVAPQECLLVREAGETEWTYFYDGIEGFAFVAGFSYLLSVERTTIENPPTDGSGYRWRLLELISKTPAP